MQEEIKKLKKKIQDLQEVNLELIRAGAKLTQENIELKKNLTKGRKESRI